MDRKEPSEPRHFLLQEAIDLMIAKRPREAFPVISQYLRINPESEEGWLLMSYAIQEPEKKIECLERVLRINPSNTHAIERFEKYKDAASSRAKAKTKSRGFPVWATIAIIGLVGLAIFVGGIWGYRLLVGPSPPAADSTQVAQSNFTATETQRATYAPGFFATMTLTSTVTPVPTLTPSPTSPYRNWTSRTTKGGGKSELDIERSSGAYWAAIISLKSFSVPYFSSHWYIRYVASPSTSADIA